MRSTLPCCVVPLSPPMRIAPEGCPSANSTGRSRRWGYASQRPSSSRCGKLSSMAPRASSTRASSGETTSVLASRCSSSSMLRSAPAVRWPSPPTSRSCYGSSHTWRNRMKCGRQSSPPCTLLGLAVLGLGGGEAVTGLGHESSSSWQLASSADSMSWRSRVSFNGSPSRPPKPPAKPPAH